MDILKPLSFHAPSAGNEKQTYSLGSSDSIKKNKQQIDGPKGVGAESQLSGSTCRTAAVTKGADVVVHEKGHCAAFVSGVCAGSAGAPCPAVLSAPHQKKLQNWKMGSSLEKSQIDD